MKGLDRMDKRILANVADCLDVDEEKLAETLGCRLEVARDRLRRLRDQGIIEGFRPNVDRGQLPLHEFLVVGSPSERTDRALLQELAHEPGVSRVFSMAASTSIAFTVHGDDLDGLRDRAHGLAADAGLTNVQAILVVKTFHEDPMAALAWSEPREEDPELEALLSHAAAR